MLSRGDVVALNEAGLNLALWEVTSVRTFQNGTPYYTLHALSGSPVGMTMICALPDDMFVKIDKEEMNAGRESEAIVPHTRSA